MNWTQYKNNSSDWILKDWAKILIPENSYNNLKHSYLQSAVNKNSCSIFWIMTTISNTFDIVFTLEEQKEIWELAKERWASEKTWWRFHKAIKLLQEYCADKKDYKFRYYSIKNTVFVDYAKKWFTIYWWVAIKENSTRDKLKDWVLWDDIETYWDVKFYHWLTFFKNNESKYDLSCVNNYKDKTKYNVYDLTNIDKLIENWMIMKTWYILMTSELEDIETALRNRKEAIETEKRIA